ncbi:hypothetical protein L6R46_31705 [Myxococcota bacterium]|nr:hypothetical protein [Myxococcota bacterium]
MNPLHDSAMEVLTANGAFEALTTLNLSRCQVGADTSRWAASLPNLESLNLSITALGYDGLIPLIECCPELRHLKLDATGLTYQGVRALAQSRQCWRLLSMMVTVLTPAGLGVLFRSPSLQQVERLELGAGLTRENGKLLVDGACPNLKFLWWHGSELGEGVEAPIRGDAPGPVPAVLRGAAQGEVGA